MLNKAALKSASDKMFADMAGAMAAGLCYVGTVTGLFRAIANQGWLTADQVAQLSALNPRYVEEWLNGMTCAGYLEYDPLLHAFRLPDEHAYFLASDGSDHFVGGVFAMAPVLLRVAPSVARAFREGEPCARDRCPTA